MTKILPTFDIENEYPELIVAGVDEAGRGPLCGPVVAGACIVKLQPPVLITDSKQMTASQREAAYDWIIKNCDWAVAECSPAEIDEINILQASLLAMKRALGGLKTKPGFVLVDGNKMPRDVNGRTVVKGDSKSISIAAASIIAKVTRDRIMTELSQHFPQYCWDKNMGYPTATHLAAINEFGINEHYRKTFGPVKKLLEV